MAVLLRFINITWKTGQLPKDWKTAVLIPLLKKNKPKSAPSSYRPISLTSCIGKLVERMINERLNWWLEHNNIITPCQAGFRSNYTTEDQLIRLTQKIQNGFQMNKDTIAVFVDLETAYDKVWRQGLFIKMRDAGIHSNMYRWIKNFLTDRTIATQIEGVTSTKECLKEGIPQGSSLSCTLFTLYINDIVKYLPDTHTALYADDLVLWSTSANMYSAQANVKTSLRNLWTYCNLWKLKLNTNKTVYTIFSRRYKVEKNVKIRYGGEEIQKDDAPQYLGLQLDPKLSMRKHIENTAAKARRRLNIVKKLASTKWERTSKHYGSCIWATSDLPWNTAVLPLAQRRTQTLQHWIRYKTKLCVSSVEPRRQHQQVHVRSSATLSHWTSVEMLQSSQLMNATRGLNTIQTKRSSRHGGRRHGLSSSHI